MFVFLPYFALSLCHYFVVPDCISLSVQAEKNRALRRSRRIVCHWHLKVSLPFPDHTTITYTCPCPILTYHYRRNPSVNTALNTQRVTLINIPPFVVTHKKKVLTGCLSRTHRRKMWAHTHTVMKEIWLTHDRERERERERANICLPRVFCGPTTLLPPFL